MTGPDRPQAVKALDGTVNVLGNGTISAANPSKATELPLRPKLKGEALSKESKDSLLPPGNALTGKQEHCTMLWA